MIKEVTHIGITVRNLENAVKFYKDILRLEITGKITMEGEETDKLFQIKNCKAKICYLSGSDNIISPPIELIEISGDNLSKEKNNNFNIPMSRVGVSEICFKVENIFSEYERLKALGVEFLSEPQYFDFTKDGFGKSIAVYFRDMDGNVLELMEYN